jgi:hypothetical protein
MNMKKLFTMMAVCLCGTMAYAQSAISAKGVTIAKGGSCQMEVVIDKATSNTAFQFDLKLPAKVSVKAAEMKSKDSYGESRVLKNQLVDETNNIYRFLSYDNGNATLTSEGNGVIITLGAEADAETGTATLNGEEMNLVVNPAGESTAQAAGELASVTVSEGVEIKITSAQQALVCSEKNLDFTSISEVKAYIATGYDKNSGKIWLTRVKDVPAKTAVLLMGEAGTYVVPAVAESNNIYKNLFVGTLTEKIVKKDEGDGNTNYILSKVDDEVGFFFAKESGSTIKAGGGYLPLPTTIEAAGTAGGNEEISMNKYGMLCYYTDESLDLSAEDNLKAYTATGYDKKGIIRLTRVKQVPAKTAVLLLAPEEAKTYTIPTISLQQIQADIFVGTLEATTIKRVEDDIVNYYVSVVNEEVGFYWASETGTKIGAKRGWLPVPKEMTSLAAGSRGNANAKSTLSISPSDDVIEVSLKSIDGDGGTTGISRIAAEAAGNDTWYNLNGQRINTPNKKGLYIKNGKKVIVK